MEEIIQLLSKDFQRNINLLYFSEQYPVSYSNVIGDSVLLKGKSDREWVMISSKDEKELVSLLNGLPCENKCFAFLEEWMIPFVAGKRKIKWMLSTNQYYLPGTATLPEKKYNTHELDPEDAEIIIANSDYGEYLSVDYIMERINMAPSSGIYLNNDLAAWGFTHDDMAIGSLHVLPDYRKKGLGGSILVDMVDKIKAVKKIPFCYIEPGNKKSINLVTKLGFLRNKSVVWLELE